RLEPTFFFSNIDIKERAKTNDLQYLTSSQMIYDIATFIQTQQVKYITYGSSYGDSLSAWSREWF
ncbi:hypothetical protein PENTCL1PPCAC_17643, partial [Pristionchus entomophagus]